MSPDSPGAELVALAAAVAAAVVLATARGRIVRCAAVAACLATTAAAGLVWVNREVDAYPTWSSLLGSTTGTDAPVPVTAAGDPGAGRVTSLTVAGRASAMTAPVYVYLPPGYADRPGTRYPVIEALHGYPGSPLNWFTRLDVTTVLDAEIAAGRMAPAVVVFPYQTPDPALDTECTDLAGGVRAETFLTVDVPAAIRAGFRVRPGPWGLTGYSAGGYCATDLALRHPGEYTAAASLSGYAEPGIRVGDGTEHTTYDELWRLAHLPVPAVSLYLTCARTDGAALRDTVALARAARGPLSVTTAFIDGGGHNAQTWRAMEAPAFDWLSANLGRPLGPAPVSSGGGAR